MYEKIPFQENPAEQELSKLEMIERDYKEIIDWRERQYEKEIEENPELRDKKSNLDVHNEVALGYTADLCKTQDLTIEERAEAIIATILHDSGKLFSKLLEHHIKGAEYANRAMDEMMEKGKEFEGVAITPEIKQKVREAIERHMNHPYLVIANKNERFPEPVDEVDRIVFDADMLANIGFKNVGFRLDSEQNTDEDRKKAIESGISALEETFRNVISSARLVEGILLSEKAQRMGGNLVRETNRIYEYLINEGILKKIQSNFLGEEEWDIKNLKKDERTPAIKKQLNEKIEKAGTALGVDSKIVKNILM